MAVLKILWKFLQCLPVLLKLLKKIEQEQLNKKIEEDNKDLDKLIEEKTDHETPTTPEQRKEINRIMGNGDD